MYNSRHPSKLYRWFNVPVPVHDYERTCMKSELGSGLQLSYLSKLTTVTKQSDESSMNTNCGRLSDVILLSHHSADVSRQHVTERDASLITRLRDETQVLAPLRRRSDWNVSDVITR